MKVPLLLVLALSALPGLTQRLPDTARPTHYDITLRPDFQNKSFSGQEAIDIQLLKPAPAITLNAADIQFQEVSISQDGKTHEATVRLDPKDQMVELRVPQPLNTGVAQIRIRYTGTLKQPLRGFYLSEANGRQYAVTQFESTDARRAFPSFDEPALKATFTLTAVVPRQDMAIANAPAVSDKPGPGPDLHTVQFATTPKISSYLVALEVGQFQCLSGSSDRIPIRVCATPERIKLGQYALSAAEFVMNWYNHYYGIRYAFPKLDLVGIPDFAAGAMENAGDITFRETDLLVDPQRSSLGARKRVALVVAHEMAHQWFGDLVTMQWWDDVWLNEGFATWMESKSAAAWKPEWHLERDNVMELGGALSADSVQATRPIHAQNVETPQQIEQLFDAIAYEKTASVLRMVESYVGPEIFREGVNAYLQQFEYGNAGAADFWNTMARVSKKPVDRIMASFVNEPGAPAVSLAAQCRGEQTEVTLSQRRYYLDRARFQQPGGELWQIPVCLKASAPGTRQACELLEKPQQTFILPGCHAWIYGNAGASGYYHALYPADMLQSMEPGVETALDPGERILLLQDEWAAVRVGREQIGDFFALAQALEADRTAGVWGQIAGVMNFAGDNLVTAADKQRYRAWVRGRLQPLAREVGWTPKPDESDDVKALRPAILGALGWTGRDPAVLQESGKLARQYLSNPAAVDPSMVDTVLDLAARNSGPDLYEQFAASLGKQSDPQDYYHYLFALTAFRQPALARRTMELALSPQVRSQDVSRVINRELANPEARETAWNFLRDHWAEVSKKTPPADVFLLAQGIASFCSPQLRNSARQFFAQHPLAVPRRLQVALERSSACIDLKTAQEPKLAAWLQRTSAATEATGESGATAKPEAASPSRP